MIGSCIKHIPLAGRDMTKFIMQSLRDRGESVLPEDLLQVSKEIKEKYMYVSKSGNLVKEFQKFDDNPEKEFKSYTSTSSVTKEVSDI